MCKYLSDDRGFYIRVNVDLVNILSKYSQGGIILREEGPDQEELGTPPP